MGLSMHEGLERTWMIQYWNQSVAVTMPCAAVLTQKGLTTTTIDF